MFNVILSLRTRFLTFFVVVHVWHERHRLFSSGFMYDATVSFTSQLVPISHVRCESLILWSQLLVGGCLRKNKCLTNKHSLRIDNKGTHFQL